MRFFDLHCDTTTFAMRKERDFTDNQLAVHFPIPPELRHHTQCFAIFTPDSFRGTDAVDYYETALRYFQNQLSKYPGYLEQVQNLKDIDRITDEGKTAAILTVEGGCVINGNLELLHKIQKDGVKMMTLTWNGENEIGFGAPSSEKGLKPFGFDTVNEMERIGMTIDIAHLSDKGIEDVFRTVSGAVVSSHSNLRSCCEHQRNLTEEQFKEIVRRGGLVGINFYKAFLNKSEDEASLNDVVRHIDRMLELGGENTICMGSDYDGCDVVNGIATLNDIGNLYKKLKENGFSETVLSKFFWSNAYHFFSQRI